MKKFSRKAATFAGAVSILAMIGGFAATATAQSLFSPTLSAPTAPSAPAVSPSDAAAAASAVGSAAEAATDAATKKTKKPAPKKKKVAARDAAKVNVNNKRSSTLVELTVTSNSAANAQPQMVASGLIAGKRKTSNLSKKGGCLYDVAGSFDDESTIEVAGMDLCKDPNINLVE